MKRILSFLLFAAFLMPWSAQAQSSAFLSEDFEGGAMPAGWTTDGSGTWSVATGDYSASTGAGEGSYNAKITHGTTGDATKLITPVMDLSQTTAAELSYMHIQRSWSGDNDELRVYYRTSSEGEWTLIPGQEYTSAVATWTSEEAIALPNLSATYQIAFEYTDNWGYGVAVDMVTVAAPPSCIKPTGLSYRDVTSNTATLNWIPGGEATAWQICVNNDETNLIDVTDTIYVFTNLTPATAYSMKVRTNCGGEQSEWSNEVNFNTTAVAEPVGDSWSDNFEAESCSWLFVNSDAHANTWVCGTAVSNGGTHSLYISNDGGTTHAYTNSGAIVVYATKLLTFTESKYQISYNWIANGESSYDYLRVVLVPSSVQLAAGTSLPSGLNTTSVPTGWIALDGGKLNGVTEWQSKSTVVNVPAGNYNLALVWRNDVSGGTNPPAAVDNISITRMACSYDVLNLAADSVTTDAATLTWVGGEATQWQVAYSLNSNFEDATEVMVSDSIYNMANLTSASRYYVRVRAYCGGTDFGSWSSTVSFRTACAAMTTFPWSEDFEEVAIGNIDIACWNNEHIAGSGAKLFAVATSSSSGNTTNLGQLPDMSSGTITDLTLPLMTIPAANAYEFMISVYRNASGSSYPQEGLRILALNGTDTAEMAFISRNCTQAYTVDETVIIPAETAVGWYTYNLAIPFGGNINLVIRGESKYGSATYFDNLLVREIPSCVKPTGLAAADSTITSTSATLSWTAGGSETAWKVRYMAAGDEDWTVVDATTNTFVLNGLQANTAYTVEVAAACGENISDWSTAAAFRTACGIEAIPYADGFENGIYCWTVGNKQSSSSSYIPYAYNYSTYAHTGSYSLRFYAYRTATVYGDSAYAILPAMNYGERGLSGHTLKFYARNYGTSATYYDQLLIGVVTDPEDINTFTLVQTVEVKGTIHNLHEIPFTAYTGQGQYMAIMAITNPETTTGTRYGYFFVDDLVVEPTPACQPLASITAVPARTKVAVTLNPKTGLSLSDAYDLVCSTTVLDAEALEAATKTVVTDSVYTITGLERSTPYYIYVRANCGEDGVSAWVSTTVTTKGLSGCDDIREIGDAVTTEYGPMCGFYGYERNGYIFTPEDGLTPGNIASIAWNFSSTNTIPAKIYLKMTQATGFTDDLVWNNLIADATLVIDSTAALTTGWNTFTLPSWFVYTGGNLMVLVESNVGGGGSASTQAYYSTTTNDAAHFYVRKDNSIDDAAAYSTFSTKGINNHRHNIRFGYCYDSEPCPAVTDMAIELVGDGTSEARINWTTADGDYLSSYDLLLSTTEVTDFSEVTPTVSGIAPTAVTYDIANLDAQTHYYVYLRANCVAEGHDEGSSTWVGVDTTTNANCPALNGLAVVFTDLNAVKATWNLAFEEQDMAFRYILSTTEMNATEIAGATPVDVDTNMVEIGNLSYEQTYYLYVASKCGNSTSEYIGTSFTTYAACAPVEHLTAARVEHNRVQLLWRKNPFGTETAYEVGIVGDESNAQIVTEQKAMLIGLTPETDYVAYVKAICSESSESEVDTIPFTTVAMPAPCATVGTGTSSANLVYTSYGNTYSQQIYTAAELNELGYAAGTITAISFYYTGASSTYEKTQSIYMGMVESSSFEGYTANDFIGGLTLVYEPTLLSYQAGWREYELTTPFVWDGTSNIVIGVLTNSTQTSSSGWGTRGTTTSPEYRSIYRYRDSNPIDIEDLASVNYGSRSTTRPNIQICFTPKACPDVTALAVSNVGTTTATATWEPMGSETSWNVYVSATPVADMTSIVGTTVTTMSYDMSGLMVDQDYWFYVQPVCTGADSWRAVTFRTVATCFPPMALTARDITPYTAIVCWQDTNAVGNYTVLYGPTATFNVDEPASYETRQAGDSMLLLTDLVPYKDYTFVVNCNCEEMPSRYSVPGTFKTGAGVPFEPEFLSTTIPSDWTRLTGLLSGVIDGSVTPTTTTSGWSLVAADTVINTTHFRANLYGTSFKYWAMTPTIDVTNVVPGEGLLLRVDLGLTPYSMTATNINKRNTGVDDKFVIIVQEMTESPVWTMDNATVWSNQEGADFVYNDIPEHGTTYYINMSKYAGKNIRIAFYGESTVSNADNYFHFGNISLNYSTVETFTETVCQGSPFDKHGFVEASSDEVGKFFYDRYAPATETALQHYASLELTVNPTLMEYNEVGVLYVGDHYVDQYIDTIVQLADLEQGYYGFAELNQYNCDSVWFVIFDDIVAAETVHENYELAEGDTLIWHELTITEPGMYYDTLTSERGGVIAYYDLTVTRPAPVPEGKTYELVTGPLADWSGNYLIVFADNKAHAALGLIGSGTTPKDFVASSGVLTISEDNKITTADTCYVTLTAMGNDGYSILLPDGTYLNRIHNGAAVSATAEAMAIDYTENGIQISGAVSGKTGTYYLYCNANNGTPMYRFYVDKTGQTQYTLPQLYKEVGGPGPGTGINTVETANEGVLKVIFNGSLYIIRDNQWYDATGRLTEDPRK